MTKVTAAEVKDLRNKTGAGMLDCKNALVEADGDENRAVEILRAKGQASVDKRSGRDTSEGAVASYIHSNKQIGAMVEIQCETDFVARNDDFLEFAYDLAMHVAANNPEFLSADDIPDSVVEQERSVFTEKTLAEGKPEHIVEKIVDGQIAKWKKGIVLLDQEHINVDKHEKKTIEELRAELSAKVGENVVVARFTRFEVGA